MKRLAATLLAGAAVISTAQPTLATGNSDARLTLHLMSVTTKNQCGRAGAVPCYQIVTSAPLYPNLRFAYVLVTGGSAAEGFSGVQFGIQYNGGGAADGIGFDVFGWTNCTGIEFGMPNPGWPNSGGGILMTWLTCQNNEPGGPGTGVSAVAGYFYCAAYSPDCLALTPRPVDNVGKVANCSAMEDIISLPSHYGVACFGGTSGYNSWCPPDPVETTTWSAIKGIYAD